MLLSWVIEKFYVYGSGVRREQSDKEVCGNVPVVRIHPQTLKFFRKFTDIHEEQIVYYQERTR